MRLAGPGAGRLDDVRVDRALGQPLHVVAQFPGLLFEHLDEQVADDLALALGIVDAFQGGEKPRLGIHADHLHPHVLGERGHDLVAFPVAQQAVVDEHAGQLIAERLVQQRGDHRGIHPAGKPQQDTVPTDTVAHRSDAVLDDVAGRPQRCAVAQIDDETLQDALPLAGMGDFGMKLQAVEAALVVRDAGDRGAFGARDELEAGRQFGDLVAMTHPDIQQAVALGTGMVLDIREQPRMPVGTHPGIAVFMPVRRLHPAPELLRHSLQSIANAEHRHAQLENQRRHPRREVGGHGLGPAGENDAAGMEHADLALLHIPGMDFAIDAGLAHTPCDQLGVLGTEIQNQDPVGMNVAVCVHGRRWPGGIKGNLVHRRGAEHAGKRHVMFLDF